MFLRVHGYATGTNGTKVRAKLYFPNDPGYVDTARMLIETGLSFRDEVVKDVPGGFHTSASCCG